MSLSKVAICSLVAMALCGPAATARAEDKSPVEGFHPIVVAGADPTRTPPTVDKTRLGTTRANFRTNYFQEASPLRLERKVTFAGKAAPLIFFWLGVAMALACTAGMAKPILQKKKVHGLLLGKPRAFSPITVLIMLLLFSSIFIAVGALLGRGHTRPMVFDSSQRWFWKGSDLADAQAKNSDDDLWAVPFENIYGVQIIRGRSSGDKSYWYYELNLVCWDGRRIGLSSHSNGKSTLNDAQQISRFLSAPTLTP